MVAEHKYDVENLLGIFVDENEEPLSLVPKIVDAVRSSTGDNTMDGFIGHKKTQERAGQ